MKIVFAVSVVFLSALTTNSNAQQKQQPENKCCCTTYDTGQCLIGVKNKVDTELDDTYQKALKRWSQPKDSSKLEEVQRLWLRYRDANCDAESSTYEGGSIAPNMFAFCQIRLTRQRIEEIKLIYLPEH